MEFEDIKLYLPKYLSSTSEKELFENLKDFPDNIDSRIYTSALKESLNIFQGDGLREMSVINLPDTTVGKVSAMVFSNTCDIDPANKRHFPSQLVYSPIINLSKYKKLIKNNSDSSAEKIKSHINSIKEQKITQIFYLPKITGVIDESIVFLDRVNNCSIDFLKTKSVISDRVFTLSDYGAYLFILKLSIHFSRIKDNVDRAAGILK